MKTECTRTALQGIAFPVVGLMLVGMLMLSGQVSGQGVGLPLISGTSGNWSHRAQVTVTGVGFGTKANATPVIWDDASGTSVTEQWSGAWPNNNPKYNTAYRTPQRGIALPHNRITKYIAGAHAENLGYNAGYNVVLFKTRTISSYPAYTYVTWYQRADDAWVFGGDNNFKTYAFSIGGTPYEMPNNWYLAYNPPTPGNRTAGTSYVYNDDSGWAQTGGTLMSPDMNGRTQWWGAAVNPMSGVWTKVEQEIKWTNQNDGYIKLWENGVLRVNYAGPTDKYPGTTRTEGIGGYARMSGQPNNWRYFADVYLDYSRARVIIGNAPTFTTSTRREVQIPTSWSDSSITLSVNLGAFSDGQQAYLYVVNSNGLVNEVGRPIQLAGGTLVGPSSPMSLRIIR